MLNKLSEADIKKNMGIFLIPEERTKVHGRPIYADDASKCGLNIDLRPINDPLWRVMYELILGWITLYQSTETQNLSSVAINPIEQDMRQKNNAGSN